MLAVLTSFDDGRLFGQLHGSGSPRVVALHGWARDHRDFDLVLGGEAAQRNAAVAQQTAPHLARAASDRPLGSGPLDAVALDLPGFGGTPAPDEAWGSRSYAEAVESMLAKLEGPVVLLGHSFGGRVAVHVAAARPDLVLGLVLTGAPLFPAVAAAGGRHKAPKPRLGYRVARKLARSGLLGEEQMEKMRQRYGSADYRAATGVMREILVKAIEEERTSDYTSSLEAITCPVELVWGEADSAAPVAVGEQIASVIGDNATLTVHPGITHLTPLLIPGELRAAIDKLLASKTRLP